MPPTWIIVGGSICCCASKHLKKFTCDRSLRQPEEDSLSTRNVGIFQQFYKCVMRSRESRGATTLNSFFNNISVAVLRLLEQDACQFNIT